MRLRGLPALLFDLPRITPEPAAAIWHRATSLPSPIAPSVLRSQSVRVRSGYQHGSCDPWRSVTAVHF